MQIDYVNPVEDRNRFNLDPHYRLYDHEQRGLIVVCVQDFDYRDYNGGRFLGYKAYDTQDEAESVLSALTRGTREFSHMRESTETPDKVWIVAEAIAPREADRDELLALLLDCRSYIAPTIGTHEEISEILGWCDCGYCTHVPKEPPMEE